MSGAAGIPTVHGGEEVKSPRVEVLPMARRPPLTAMWPRAPACIKLAWRPPTRSAAADGDTGRLQLPNYVQALGFHGPLSSRVNSWPGAASERLLKVNWNRSPTTRGGQATSRPRRGRCEILVDSPMLADAIRPLRLGPQDSP